MDRQSFIAAYGEVFEHSPWIAELVYERTGGEPPRDAERLHERFRAAILEAGRERQLELLRAHPELGVGKADQASLTKHSRNEQSDAGLDQCTRGEFEAFRALNQRYREKFGFPFIIAVRGRGREEILRIFERRLGNRPADEFREALAQVIRIGRLRIEAVPDA